MILAIFIVLVIVGVAGLVVFRSKSLKNDRNWQEEDSKR